MNWHHHKFNTFVYVDGEVLHCFVKEEYMLHYSSLTNIKNKIEYEGISFYYLFVKGSLADLNITHFPIEEDMVPFVYVDFIKSNQWLLYVGQ